MKYLPILSIFAIVIACNVIFNGSKEDNKPPELAGSKWELIHIRALEGNVFSNYEENIWEVPDDQFYRIHFIDESEITGEAYCNECVGEYEVTPDDSILVEWVCTLAICGRSGAFISAMDNSKTFEIDHDTLFLYYLGKQPYFEGDGILTFIRK